MLATSSRRKWVCTLGILLAAAGGALRGEAAESAVSVTPTYYQLVLEGSLFQGDPKNLREIILDLEQVGERWGTVYGVARNYNMAFHKGAVKEAKISGDTVVLKIGMDITPDKWIPGGQGEYTVTVKKGADGKLSGTYMGKYNGADVSGAVKGTVYAPTLAKDYVPLAPQEHPRLLLRKSDLPMLREKAKTPFGQAAMKAIESSGTPTSLGFMYQMTGDKAWAVKAEAEAEEYLKGKKPEGSPFVPMMSSWGRLEHLAQVYDLCYDALSEDYKARYRAWIGDFCFQVYFAPENMGTNINWHVVSNHTANVFSGLTTSGLVLFDEPAAAPKEPSAPFLEETLAPAKDFKPAEGVPVVALTPGKSPTEWLTTEPLRRVTQDDPREVFYGLENVNPAPGTKVQVGDFPLTFDKMAEAFKSKADIGGVNVASILTADAKAKLKEPLTMAIYTVIDVKEPGQYVFTCGVSRSNLSQASLAGKLLTNGQVVKLEKGLYPLMTLVQWRMKWDDIAPSLKVATEADVKAWAVQAEQVKTQYQTRKQGYATVLENWKRTAGGDPAFSRMLRLARFTSTMHCSDAVGKGGFQGESGHYSNDACYGHAQLWPEYRRVMGYDLTPYGEYVDYLPRKIVGGPQDITGTTDIEDRIFPGLFPAIKEEFKPEMLTAWNNKAKVANPELPVEVLKYEPVRSFINYPLEIKAAPIGTKLPKVWEAPGLGYYMMRSGWEKDAFIAQVAVKSQIIGGWNGENAGTYRLRGLGQEWVTGVTDRYRTRQQESVVWIPELDLADGSRGRLTYFKAGDQTMTLSVNLDEVYETTGRYWYSKFGHMRTLVAPKKEKDGTVTEPPAASGITGMRALAFDFSGESGAPCLFVVVDKVDGGKGVKRTWLFQPPTAKNQERTVDKGAKPALVVNSDARGFSITGASNGSSMAGTFVYPAEPKVQTEPLTWEYIKTVGIDRGAKVTKTINCLSVAGEDHFFFVGTVSGGKQPEVKIEGSGLNATAVVGNRTVKFDGEKVVFGKVK